MTPDLNRAQRSALHSAMLSALNLPITPAEDDDQFCQQAWIETICWVEFPEDVLALAYRVANFLADFDYVEVDAKAMREIEGAMTVNLALKLNGIRPRPSGRLGTIWTNCPPGSRGELIKLPETLN